MDTSTQNHLRQQRQALLFRQSELRAELHAAELTRQAPRDSTAVMDQKDLAARQQMNAIDASQEQRDRDEAQEVAAALRRLDEGNYGDCLDCGQAIAYARLLVQPAALRCAQCQAALEQAVEFARR
jgi:DnaK suppressor protein